MDSTLSAAAEKEIQFVLSLLNITNPGQPASEQSQALQELLSSKSTR